jgi:catechol 2,3-dioxygenase-like lactoylglutathione lyase family enzyme
MKLKKIDHIGINVDDLPAAIDFFRELGLEVEGEAKHEGEWLDRIVGLSDVRTEFAYMRTPDGQMALEIIKYHSPPDEGARPRNLSNTWGFRHLAFEVEDLEAMLEKLKKKGAEPFGEVYRYEDSYKLIYIRGPEGIILELAEAIS